MPELKPCPHCGSENIRVASTRAMYVIACYDCSMAGPCSDAQEAAIAAWNSLPRALTWGEEPPKVAGWYWWRDVSHKGEATIQYMSQSQVERLKTYPGEEWAGPIPIPMPLEPEES